MTPAELDALCERLDHPYERQDALCGLAAAAIRELRTEFAQLAKVAARADEAVVRTRADVERLTRERDEYSEGFREAMNDHADTLEKLDIALATLKEIGVHVTERWCWCEPVIASHEQEAQT